MFCGHSFTRFRKLWQSSMGARLTTAAHVLLGFAVAWSAAGAWAQDDPNRPIDFNRDIRPILSDKCFHCHGPDAEQRQAGLRLDQREGATSELDSGVTAIVPGKPDESELIYRVESEDEYERMPPADAKLPPLTAEQKELLRRWIAAGANWEEHWSLVPLRDTPLPAVKAQEWVQNPIDQFVLAKLEAKQITPAPEADKETLLRRVYFTLTGLPPTPTEVDAFLADESPDAYEKVVDRLLASPRYGEHVAVHWLDLARYSDTFGYQVDKDRRVWPWRDWVVKALNENLPYDDFITWQLAGDLLPDATDEQILATAFNRLHPQNAEGGSTEEEFRIEYVADRVETFGLAFLGLTVQCAKCHDHKFDPITQKEFYQLSDFFDNIDECGLSSYFTDATPTPALLLTEPGMRDDLTLDAQVIATAEERCRALPATREAEFTKWLDQRTPSAAVAGLVARFDFDSQEEGKFPATNKDVKPARSNDSNKLVPGKHGQAVLLSGDDEVKTEVGNFDRQDPFTVSLRMQTPDVKDRAVVFHRSRAWTDAGSRGYELLVVDGKLQASLIHFWPGNAISVRTPEQIPTGQWLHVTVTYDGSGRAEGLKLFLDGKLQASEVVRDKLTKNITGGGQDHIYLGARYRDRGLRGGMIDELQVFDRQLTALEVAQVFDGQSLNRLLAKPAAELTADERSLLRDFYLATVDPAYAQMARELYNLRTVCNYRVDMIPEIMVMRELAVPRPTYLLKRGQYDAPGEEVFADTLHALPPMPAGQPHNRLGLAHWLTDPNHPLTSRVAVNRFWQLVFGYGLVRTPEDYGSQGEPPTHPELFDWLAKDFIDSGWDLKRFFKQLVMSSTFRQSSVDHSLPTDQDLDNRLLARGPSRRLPAEAIRDNALFVSGLLVEKMGGPPVVPYEITESFKPRERSKGEDLYRRSLYTFWQQTGPAPVMEVFDAAKRDVCVARRERTSTPLQALVLLNDPQMIEASRVLSERLARVHPEDNQQLLRDMFYWLTSRPPDAQQLALIVQMFEEQLEHFAAHPESAAEYLAIGDSPRDKRVAVPRLAALTVVANALFNYDECVILH